MSDRKRSGPRPTEQARLQDTVRLSAEGLAKVLGDLEARVMRVVWSLGEPAPARLVHERVAEQHAVALHTVITVLNNLVGKGLLTRERANDVYHYRALLSESEFLERSSRRVVEGILSLSPEAVAASFVDVMAERDPARLRALMERIRTRLEEGGDGDDG
jgi:predicted transcriptional regulator